MIAELHFLSSCRRDPCLRVLALCAAPLTSSICRFLQAEMTSYIVYILQYDVNIRVCFMPRYQLICVGYLYHHHHHHHQFMWSRAAFNVSTNMDYFICCAKYIVMICIYNRTTTRCTVYMYRVVCIVARQRKVVSQAGVRILVQSAIPIRLYLQLLST